EAVKLLLEHGADPNLKDIYGHTALFISHSNGVTYDSLLDADNDLDLYNGEDLLKLLSKRQLKNASQQIKTLTLKIKQMEEMVTAIYYSPEGPYFKYLKDNSN